MSKLSSSTLSPATLVSVALLLTSCARSQAEDWLGFRGPNVSGIYDGNLPTHWSDTQNLKWALPLRGKGVSSPIVVGGRVFVTTFSGFGQDPQSPGDLRDLRRHLVCVDRHDGSVLWQRSPPTRFPEDRYEGFITDHGYASCTPVSDGERVYAFFGKSGIYAFDLDGTLLWQKPVGSESGPTEWGSAASPSIHKELLLVNACDETQALIAFDRLLPE
ncbi:MAG: PQQ-binding-like beta-propeller repeat protein [Planctomycetota bacterium]